ncbi:MAG: hypothetical protein HYZ34_01970 [Ignavibacteriae bacterium]|nr:hypothetical protein [Ignavibacteriota bacterium]
MSRVTKAKGKAPIHSFRRIERTFPPLLTVYILQDENRFMAKCTELDLITEMDDKEQALDAMLEIISEYAYDYNERKKVFSSSPNRAHHYPYIDAISKCKSKWDLLELVNVKYGHIQLQAVA